jgi:hypothetical protein
MDFEWIPFAEYFAAPGRVPIGRSIQPSAIKRADLPASVTDVLRPPVERDRAGLPGRSTLSGGQALVGRLAGIAVRDGATIAVDHHVVGFERDATGRVDGVHVETPQGPVTIRARRGVLIAAGGFEGSAERRAEHGTPGRAEWSMAPGGTNTGEVIDAASAIGAATDFSGEGWFCPGLEQPDGSGTFTLGFRSGLMVDATGNRYGNECLPYDRFGRLMAASPDRIPSWFLFDSREGGRLPAIAMPEGDPQEHLAAGTWVCAETIAELATAAGLPADPIAATVERYNGFAATGADVDFGRGEDEYDTFFASSGTPNKALVPLDHPPFYAARFVLSDLGTKGGLVTDATGRDRHRRRTDPWAVRRQQLHRVGLRVGVPRSGGSARCGDGLRVAGRGGHRRQPVLNRAGRGGERIDLRRSQVVEDQLAHEVHVRRRSGLDRRSTRRSEVDERAAAVVLALPALDQPPRRHPGHLLGQPALLPLHALAELVHPQRLVGHIRQVDEHLVVGQRQAAGPLQLTVERPGQQGVRVEPASPGELFVVTEPARPHGPMLRPWLPWQLPGRLSSGSAGNDRSAGR